uniref:hypothetical protein n=1 Tax=Escherichia TaxID=561 RepID=UPI001BDCD5FA
TALSAEFTIGEGELMAHDVPLGCAPDEYDDLISGTCSHLPKAYLICHIIKNKQTSYTQYYSQNLWINTQIIHDKIDCLAKLNSNK